MRILLAFLILVQVAHADWNANYWLLPENERLQRENRTDARGAGSCVQASLAMAGVQHDIPAASLLLENSAYGPPILGGSYPSRVNDYCAARGINVYNIEGTATQEWIKWALRNKRYAAVSYGIGHMITAVGISSDGGTVYLVDNNKPSYPFAMSWNDFMQQQMRMGGWTIILKSSAATPWTAPTDIAKVTPTPAQKKKSIFGME